MSLGDESLIWATRGRAWGFRFLRDAGLADPLPTYDQVFSQVGDDPEICQRVGASLALKFPDPLGRRDAAGRVIPHEFVVRGPMAYEIRSVEDGLSVIWPLVAEEFQRVWDLPAPNAISRNTLTDDSGIVQGPPRCHGAPDSPTIEI